MNDEPINPRPPSEDAAPMSPKKRAIEIALGCLTEAEGSMLYTPVADDIAPWVIDAVDQALGEAAFGSPGEYLGPIAEQMAEAEQVFKFTLVMAEVIFNCELGIQSRRIQFVSKADTETFPRARLTQLQMLAASNVVAELKAQSAGAIKDVTVEAVHLLGTIDLGWMTEDAFLYSQCEIVASSETPSEDNAIPPADPDAAPAGDNVVQFKPA